MTGSVTGGLLAAARDRIVDGWCQGQMAVDRDGVECDPRSGEAVGWCAAGALRAVTDDVDVRHTLIWWLTVARHGRHGESELSLYNDRPGRTVDDIVLMYDQAIASADARG